MDNIIYASPDGKWQSQYRPDLIKYVRVLNSQVHIEYDKIIEVACDYFGILPGLLAAPCRRREITDKRYIIYYFAKKYTSLTYREIGEPFNQHYATVIYGIKIISNLMAYDHDTQQIVLNINNKLIEI